MILQSGIKETWKVWKTDDTPLGISQTVHTGSEIEIAGQVIDIEALNGQSFDRQYIVDNEAEILAITDSVNYDFDEGIDSVLLELTFYTILITRLILITQVVFTGYLEIDPTFDNFKCMVNIRYLASTIFQVLVVNTHPVSR